MKPVTTDLSAPLWNPAIIHFKTGKAWKGRLGPILAPGFVWASFEMKGRAWMVPYTSIEYIELLDESGKLDE